MKRILVCILVFLSIVLHSFEIQKAELQWGPAERKEAIDRPVTIYDPFVIYRIDWGGLKANVPYEYRWYSPQGKLVSSYKNSRDQDSNGGGWGRIFTHQLWKEGPGRWTVEFFYDGQLQATDSFDFLSPSGLEYLSWIPENPRGILVAVHSSSMNPVQYFHEFRPMAEELGLALLAPFFPEHRFHYQRVFLRGRADLQLQVWLKEFRENEVFEEDLPLLFYGHSAGAQFSHRYLLAHPEGVKGAVFSAPGFWTLLTEEETYPYGLVPHPSTPVDIRLQPEAFLKIPLMVITGAQDTKRDSSLNQSVEADRQGPQRVERARTWLTSVQTFSQVNGLSPWVEQFISSEAGHSDLRRKTMDEIQRFFQSLLN